MYRYTQTQTDVLSSMFYSPRLLSPSEAWKHPTLIYRVPVRVLPSPCLRWPKKKRHKQHEEGKKVVEMAVGAVEDTYSNLIRRIQWFWPQGEGRAANWWVRNFLGGLHTAKSQSNITNPDSDTRALVTAKKHTWLESVGMGLTGAGVSVLSEHLADGSSRPVAVIAIGCFRLQPWTPPPTPPPAPGSMETAAFLMYVVA